VRHAICSLTAAAALCVPASTAFAAADTGANSHLFIGTPGEHC
jgi:hypothetical protein